MLPDDERGSLRSRQTRGGLVPRLRALSRPSYWAIPVTATGRSTRRDLLRLACGASAVLLLQACGPSSSSGGPGAAPGTTAPAATAPPPAGAATAAAPKPAAASTTPATQPTQPPQPAAAAARGGLLRVGLDVDADSLDPRLTK